MSTFATQKKAADMDYKNKYLCLFAAMLVGSQVCAQKKLFIPEDLRGMDLEADTSQWSLKRSIETNDLIFMWGLVLPVSMLSAFVFRWPVPVTFFLLKADQIAKCFVAIVKVNRFRWIKNLTR